MMTRILRFVRRLRSRILNYLWDYRLKKQKRKDLYLDYGDLADITQEDIDLFFKCGVGQIEG